jgi:hypothetical protein
MKGNLARMISRPLDFGESKEVNTILLENKEKTENTENEEEEGRTQITLRITLLLITLLVLITNTLIYRL